MMYSFVCVEIIKVCVRDQISVAPSERVTLV